MDKDSNYPLNSEWNLWYHSIKDTRWTKESYKQIYTLKNLYDYKIMEELFQKNYLQNCMLFLMRNDIYPLWEDPENIEGCCVSFKIPSKDLVKTWNTSILKIICEEIHKDKDNFNELNGVSISPKKEFNILKLWVRSNVKKYTTLFHEFEPHIQEKNSLVKKNEF
jgi:hypothetical protein